MVAIVLRASVVHGVNCNETEIPLKGESLKGKAVASIDAPEPHSGHRLCFLSLVRLSQRVS